MGSELMSRAIEALRYEVTAEEAEAARTPPYPEPTGRVAFTAATRSALSQRLQAGGPDPVVTTRRGSMGLRLHLAAEPTVRSSEGIHPIDGICLLLGAGLLDVDQVEEILSAAPHYDPSWMRYAQIAVVNRCVADGDLRRAEREARHPRMGQDQWIGFRAVGRGHAELGDSAAFFALWRSYDAAQDRHWMGLLKQRLVQGVAARHGWSDALRVTADRRIGPAYLTDVFHPFVQQGRPEELLQLFAQEQSLREVPETDQLTVLVEAIDAATAGAGEHDHPLTDVVADRLVALDPTVSKTVMRARDHLLWRLSSHVQDADRMQRLRRAVRTPRLRSEMKV